MTKGSFGFHGAQKDPTLADEWYFDSPSRTVTYTIRTGPSKMAFVYECQIFENRHASAATETILGEQLSRGGRKAPEVCFVTRWYAAVVTREIRFRFVWDELHV